PLLCAHHHPVASALGGAAPPSRLHPRRDVRDAVPALEHRTHVCTSLSPYGRPYRLHHGGPPRGARRCPLPAPHHGVGGGVMLERYFELSAQGTTVGREARAGLT